MIAYRYFFPKTINSLYSALIIGSMLFCHDISYAKTSWFSRYKETEELLELKPKKKPCSLSIQHELSGSVTLQGWHQDHIATTIRKNTATPDDAARISTTLTQTEHGIITLKTTVSEDLHKDAQVDITVHVPHHIATTIITHNDVSMTNTNNNIRVKTETGDINTNTTRGALHLETEKGDITVTESHGAATAYTDRGNITVTNSYNSIKAETARGFINTRCIQVPSTARIDLRTQKRGVITLALPESTQAQLIADTTRGTITADVLITLDRQTTVLNSGTYQDQQRHIRGTIGNQANAEIRLNSTKGIHITTIDAKP